MYNLCVLENAITTSVMAVRSKYFCWQTVVRGSQTTDDWHEVGGRFGCVVDCSCSV